MIFKWQKFWYDRACESGNIVAQRDRDQFIKQLEERQQHSSDELDAIKAANNYMNLLQAKN